MSKPIGYNVATVASEFPVLDRTVYDKRLVYLDNAATTQKPKIMINAINEYYTKYNANVHRSVHALGEQSTLAFERTRENVKHFIQADNTQEIIFVKGTTDAINLVAQSYARPRLKPGDEILVSEMEHHSNIVPWQIVCEQTGCSLKVIPITEHAEINLQCYADLLNEHTKIVAIGHASNAFGSINPIQKMITMAHAVGALVLVDGAQGVPHLNVNVTALDCDFYAFSSHKMYGPTGIGVLYGKQALLEDMEPYQSGGDMIAEVSFKQTSYNILPYKFEAGTPNIAGVIGLGATLRYLTSLDFNQIMQHEQTLLKNATACLLDIPGLRIIGDATDKVSVISFVIEGIHPHDIGTIIDREGIAVRAGHHCAMPAMERFNLPATTRASFGIYNTEDDVKALVNALYKVKQVFK